MTQDCNGTNVTPYMRGRLEARAWAVLAIAFLIYLATQVHHAPSELGFALSTGGALLITPQIIESLGPRPMTAGRIVRPYKWFMAATGAVGVSFVAIGLISGHLHTVGPGRRDYLIGAAILTFVAMLVPTLYWLLDSTRTVVSTLNERQHRRLYRGLVAAEHNGVWTTLGGCLFIVGIAIQFVTSA